LAGTSCANFRFIILQEVDEEAYKLLPDKILSDSNGKLNGS
jgi:hypothetical protein